MKSPERDREIAKFLLSSFAGESFFVYRSFGTEVDTEGIIDALTVRGISVCVPRLVGREMLACPLEGEMRRNALGFSEPVSGEDKPCAIALTPLLAADGEGYRLGYGGGYYDRYFITHPNVLRVGLCYEGQLTARLPREAGDIPLHAAVTERGVKRFQNNLTGRE